MSDPPIILGIESSCDETAAAVVVGGRLVKSNVIATQHHLHEEYAGVVPEIASRAHLERITPVIREALRDADLTLADLDAIAVGNRPGLIGSLLVGVSAAKTLAWSLGKPLIGIDHILAHMYAPALNDAPLDFPAIGLVVSGGHTSLFRMNSPLDAAVLGRTIDDAIGEAYDKAATILDLPYPGGPEIDRLAASGNDCAHDFPVANLGRESLDFSFSGLKTSLRYKVQGVPQRGGGTPEPVDLSDQDRADFAASFQRAAIRAVSRNLARALDQHPDTRSLIIGGGVSANSRLRAEATDIAARTDVTLRLPPMQYCLDNAAMIAGLAHERLLRNDHDHLTLEASPRRDVAPA